MARADPVKNLSVLMKACHGSSGKTLPLSQKILLQHGLRSVQNGKSSVARNLR